MLHEKLCRQCLHYQIKFLESLRHYIFGNVEGLESCIFYLDRMIEYPVNEVLEREMSAECSECKITGIKGVFSKDALTSTKDNLANIKRRLEGLPPEERIRTIRESVESFRRNSRQNEDGRVLYANLIFNGDGDE